MVGFNCGTGKSVKLVSGGRERDLYRSSFASLTLAPGEIVNVGYIHMNASFYGRSALGRPVRIDVRISDWPVADLERYKSSRPAIYQQMTTRLMTATPRSGAPDQPSCSKILALKAEGKVAAVPASCLPARTARSP